MAIAVGSVVEFATQGRIPGEQMCNNVLDYKITNLGGQTDQVIILQDILTALLVKWTGMIIQQGSNCLTTMMTAKEVVGATGSGAIGAPIVRIYGAQLQAVTALTGGVGGDALPNFVTCSIRKLTLDPTRYFRGALRFGPLAESQTNAEGNYLTGAAVAAIQVPLDALKTFTGIAGVQGELGVLSLTKFVRNLPPGVTLSQCHKPVVTLKINEFVGRLDSRQRKLAPR